VSALTRVLISTATHPVGQAERWQDIGRGKQLV